MLGHSLSSVAKLLAVVICTGDDARSLKMLVFVIEL